MIDYRKNLEERAKILISCDDLKYRAMVMENCKRDIVFWFQYFAFTDRNSGFIDDGMGDKIPFILFDFQKEFILDLWDAIIE